MDIFLRIQIGIAVEKSGTELVAQHVLHGTFKGLGFHQSLVDSLLQMLIVGSKGEIDVIAAIDSGSSLLHGCLQVRQLVDGGIVAHNHAVEPKIATEDLVENLTVGHALRSVNGMIARHHTLTACLTDHRLVGQQDLLHQFLLVGITTATIAEVVLRTGADTFLQVTLLQTLHKGYAHGCRQIAVFAIGLFQTVEGGVTTHVDHR